MKPEQLQSLAASFESARAGTDDDRVQVWVTKEEAGEVSRALQARIGGHQLLGVLPAGCTVLDICQFDGNLIVATSQGVYRMRGGVPGGSEKLELIPMTDERPEPRAVLQTFDEWHKAQYGQSFEDAWMQPMMDQGAAMRALTRKVRDYSTWVKRAAA